MDKDDLDLLISEFSRNRDSWADLGLQSLSRSHDLATRNGDREFNLFLSITSLSAAFLTIVVPLIRDSLSASLVLAIIFFFITSILGIILLLVTIRRDKRLINEDGRWEHEIYMRYLTQTINILNKLEEYKKSTKNEVWGEMESMVGQYFESRQGLNGEAEQRKKDKEKEPSAIAANYLKIGFWLFFSLSLATLAGWLVAYISTASTLGYQSLTFL